jgi:hypothetical protein
MSRVADSGVVDQFEIEPLFIGPLHDPQFHTAQLGNRTIPVGFKHLKDSGTKTAAVPRERAWRFAWNECGNPGRFKCTLRQRCFKIRRKRRKGYERFILAGWIHVRSSGSTASSGPQKSAFDAPAA